MKGWTRARKGEFIESLNSSELGADVSFGIISNGGMAKSRLRAERGAGSDPELMEREINSSGDILSASGGMDRRRFAENSGRRRSLSALRLRFRKFVLLLDGEVLVWVG
jgi:hypothetical protein